MKNFGDVPEESRKFLKISVVGLGKIGLPLAVQYASKGHFVTGVDINEETVALVNEGKEPFPGEAGLQELLSAVVFDGRLVATIDTAEAVSDSDVIVIVVPLFVDSDSQPDFGWMDEATRSVGSGLGSGSMVIYETTLPIGTTRNRFGPMLADVSGLTPGDDFQLAFSPERVLTGRVFADLRKYPKLVGGIDSESERRADWFYEQVLDFDDRPDLARKNGVWSMGSAEAAEMAKLAETTYRDVNIGLANQFAKYSDAIGADVFSIIEACNSQPFSHLHQPGISVGGHCIPVYPRLYLYNDPDATIVKAAREVNSSMPSYAVERLESLAGNLENLKVAVFGIAYREGVKETAFSGAFPLVEELIFRGAKVSVDDPLYSDDEIAELGLEAHHRSMTVDAVVIHTAHEEYGHLTRNDFPGLKYLVDGRQIVDPEQFPDVAFLRIGQN